MSALCSVDTCGESTEDGRRRPATTLVSQVLDERDWVLVAVCDMHADGWHDGADEWLPHVSVNIEAL